MSGTESREHTICSNIQTSLSAPPNVGVSTNKVTRIKHIRRINNNRRSPTFIVSGKCPSKISWKTNRTFKFKFNVQMPRIYPSPAPSYQVPPDINVLGFYNKYSPLIKSDPEFLMQVVDGIGLLVSLTGQSCFICFWNPCGSVKFFSLIHCASSSV